MLTETATYPPLEVFSFHKAKDVAFFTICLTVSLLCYFYIILSYWCIKNQVRTNRNAIIKIVVKSTSSFCFAVVYFLMLSVMHFNPPADVKRSTRCAFWGFFLFTFWFTSHAYFIDICYDLYQTLVNPFRNPNEHSTRRHILIWTIAITINSIFAGLGIYRYRPYFDICATCDTGSKFNIYQAFLLYIPFGFGVVIGCAVCIKAMVNLRKGLAKTFELRSSVIRRQLFSVFFFLLLSGAVLIPLGWIVFFRPDSGTDHDSSWCVTEPSYKTHSFATYVLMLYVPLLLLQDALGWYCLVRTLTTRKNGEKTGNYKTLTLRIRYGDAVFNQNLSSALRTEVVTYITHGIALSIQLTALETYDEQHLMRVETESDIDMDSGDNHSLAGSLKRYVASRFTVTSIVPHTTTHHRNTSRSIVSQSRGATPRQSLFRALKAKDTQRRSTIERNNKEVFVTTANAADDSNSNIRRPKRVSHTHAKILDALRQAQKKAKARKSESEDDDTTTETEMANTPPRGELTKITVSKEQDQSSTGYNSTGECRPISGADSADKISYQTHSLSPIDSGNVGDEIGIHPRLLSDIASETVTKPKTKRTKSLRSQSRNNERMRMPRGVERILAVEKRVLEATEPSPEDDCYPTDIRKPSPKLQNSYTSDYEPSFNCFKLYLSEEMMASIDLRIGKRQNIEDVAFVEYAPHAFRYLRTEVYGCSDIKYLQEVFPDQLAGDLVNEKFSEGKSGAFFFFTQNWEYMIKTVTHSELQLLLDMLPKYLNHMVKHPKSLVNKYMGAYAIRMYGLVIYFVVVKNIFIGRESPQEKYDIKGSWIARHTNHHVESGKLMKDEDLHKTVKLSAAHSRKLYRQLEEDTLFLCNLGIMDYSLLLGIYYTTIDTHALFRNKKHDRNVRPSFKPPISVVSNDSNSDLFVTRSVDRGIDDYPLTYDYPNPSMGPNSPLLLGPNYPMPIDRSAMGRGTIDGIIDNNELPRDTAGAMSRPEFNDEPSEVSAATAPNIPYAGGGSPTTTTTERSVPTPNTNTQEVLEGPGVLPAEVIEGPGVYYFGLIDTLQEWNITKKAEWFAKVVIQCKDSQGISCMEPVAYRQRFLKKMREMGISN